MTVPASQTMWSPAPVAQMITGVVAVPARGSPGARCDVIADAGHMINMERPAEVSHLLVRFMDRLPSAAARR